MKTRRNSKTGFMNSKSKVVNVYKNTDSKNSLMRNSSKNNNIKCTQGKCLNSVNILNVSWDIWSDLNKLNYGKAIAPGTSVDVSLNTLTSRATLIPPINLKKTKKVIGNNTTSAVRAGFFWGYVGLIDNIIQLIKKESKKPFNVIITGGFSKLFCKSLKSKVVIDKDITIKGLIRTARLFNF